MNGMDANTGKRLSGRAHLSQSVADILVTLIGTVVCLRDYGSALLELQDKPMNGLGRIRLFAAIATALARWEPRLRLTRVALTSAGSNGQATIDLEGIDLEEPAPNSLFKLTLPLSPFTA